MNLHFGAVPHAITEVETGLAANLRRAALALPGIRDAHACSRVALDGVPRTLLYIVAAEPPSPAQARTLREGAPGERLTLVRVADLPRDASGAVDETALAALPAIDDDLADALAIDLGVPVAAVPRRTMPPVDRSVRLHDPLARAEVVGADLPPEPTSRRTLADVLFHAATHAGERGASFVGDRVLERLSYPEMARAALCTAGGLRARGCRPGDAVILVMRDARTAIVDFWGAVLAGLVPTPVAAPTRMDASDQGVRRMLDAAALFPGAALIAQPDIAKEIRALLDEAGETARPLFDSESLAGAAPLATAHVAAPGDVAIRFLTSGSTGRPKIVPQTHARLLAFCLATTLHHEFTQDEVSLNWLPLDHVGGLVMCHLRDLYLGCAQVHGCYRALLRDPLLWVDWCSEHRATVTWAPNFAFALVGDEIRRGGDRGRRWSLERLRIVFNGAEPISRRHAARFLSGLARHGLAEDAVRPVWGMSETCSGVIVCTRFREDTLAGRDNPVSVGVPIPGLRMRVVDKHGAVANEGETGRLQIAGATVLDGYVENAVANAAAFTADGWFDTGDLATIEDRRLHIVGRDKDVVMVNGQKHDTSSLEARIEEVPGVRASNTAVVAERAPGEDRDTITVFFTPAEPDAPLAPVLARIRASIAGFAGLTPDVIVATPVEAVPKTSIGKIQKALLQRALADGTLEPTWRRPAQSDDGMRPVTSWARAWLPRPAHADGADGSPVDVVELDGDAARAERLAAPLRASGIPVRILAPDAALAAFAAGDCAPRLLIAADGEADPPTRLLPLLASLTAPRYGIRLVVLGRAAQHVSERDEADPRAAAAIALLRTAALENPLLRVRHVDREAQARDEHLAPRLLDELADGAREPEIAYRGSLRLASRLRAAVPTGLGGATLQAGGAYVVVGGVGGVGAHLCSHLLQALGARVLVVGSRREEDLDARSAIRLAELRALGGERVRYAAIDVTQADAAQALDAAIAELGQPDGLFHLATTLSGAPLHATTEAQLDAALAVKNEGTHALLTLARRRGIGLVVLFSSVNGFFGGSGHGAYAAAARAQEAIAESACTNGKGPIVHCLSWSMWEETGVSEGFGHASMTRRSGFDVIPPTQAIASLDAALSMRCAVAYLGLDDTQPRMRMEIDAAADVMDELEIASAGDACMPAMRDAFGVAVRCRTGAAGAVLEGAAPARVVPALATASSAAAAAPAARGVLSETALCIAEAWRDLLALPARPGLDDDVFALGASSLVIPRIQQSLEQKLCIEIDVLDLFEHTTLAKLTAHVETLIRASNVED